MLEVSSGIISEFKCEIISIEIIWHTYGRSNGKSDAVAAFFDEVNDVTMMKTVDINMIHRQDSVSNL